MHQYVHPTKGCPGVFPRLPDDFSLKAKFMSNEASTNGTQNAADETPSADVVEVRRLLHDMNNSLEIIIQATYLVGTLELGEDGKQWVKLLEQGVEQVAALNKQLRDKIRSRQLA